jgi:hypothetical protein
LAVTLLFVEKIRQSAALFCFGLRIVGFLQIFYSQAAIPKTIVDSPAFLEHGSAEKIVVCAHTTHNPNKGGCLEAKHIAVDVLFKAYPMIPLSG